MNPLPLINDYLSQHPNGRYAEVTRANLLAWLTARNHVGDIQLAADVMIAAGIGRQQEQTATVHCHAH